MRALAAVLHVALAIKKTRGIPVILVFLTITRIMTRVKLVAITTRLLARLQMVAGKGVIAIIVMITVQIVLIVNPMIACSAMKAPL